MQFSYIPLKRFSLKIVGKSCQVIPNALTELFVPRKRFHSWPTEVGISRTLEKPRIDRKAPFYFTSIVQSQIYF